MMDVARLLFACILRISPGRRNARPGWLRENRFHLACLLGLSIGLGACTTDADKELAFPDPVEPQQPEVAEAAVPPAPAHVSTHTPAKMQAHPRKEDRKTRRTGKPSDKTASPPEKLAAVEPHSLIGQGPSGVAKLLGVPSSASQRDVSLIWTYASNNCAFQVYFYPDIKTSLWHALQYTSVDKNGGALDTSQLCIQRILAERGNGAD